MKNLFKVLSIVLFSTLVFSCNQDDDDIINGNDSDDNKNLKKGQIEIKGYPDNDNKMSFIVTATKITIDWGDGSIEELTPNGTESEFVHEYANQDFQTIKINTEVMTSLVLGNGSHYDDDYDIIRGRYNELRLGDCPDLKNIRCSNQKLTELSIKSAPALTWLSCSDNQLTSLDISGCPALTRLECDDNQITSLNVSGCPALTRLNCSYNKLTSLDVSKCPALAVLYCYGNQLTSLDVSSCPALTELLCSSNQLTSLDVSKCPALRWLECSNNQLTSLDVSKCRALTWLYCSGNQLTSLDVSECPALTVLFCSDNQLTAASLNSLFSSLPNMLPYVGYIDIYSNPGTFTCDGTIAEDKGWSVFYNIDDHYQTPAQHSVLR